MSIEDACQVMRGEALDPATTRQRFRGVSIDTRTIGLKNAFFCLQGEQSDGHRFAPLAVRCGAGAVVAGRSRISGWRRLGVPVIGVDDPLTALGDLAAEFRKRFPTRYIAVTGSVGKTTTKELIAGVIAARLSVYKSPGNYNNLIGIPLALLARSERLGRKQTHGVLEFGMSTPGEIARLTEIVGPSWGVMTRVGAAHLEQMKTVAAVARAKRELFDNADPRLVAFLNADDPYQRRWMAHWQRRTVTYGIGHEADFTADRIAATPRAITFRVNGRHAFLLGLAGEYNVANALAAIALGRHFRIPFAELAERLRRVRPVGERSRIMRLGRVTLIEDCYNANPTSTVAALESLRKYPCTGRRIAVLGTMRELGRDSRKLHEQVGRVVSGVDLLITVGKEASAYRRTVPSSVATKHFGTPQDAARFLRKSLDDGDVVLIKASRAVGLEEVSKRLKESRGRAARRP